MSWRVGGHFMRRIMASTWKWIRRGSRALIISGGEAVSGLGAQSRKWTQRDKFN